MAGSAQGSFYPDYAVEEVGCRAFEELLEYPLGDYVVFRQSFRGGTTNTGVLSSVTETETRDPSGRDGVILFAGRWGNPRKEPLKREWFDFEFEFLTGVSTDG
jgi:hypothetical protein